MYDMKFFFFFLNDNIVSFNAPIFFSRKFLGLLSPNLSGAAHRVDDDVLALGVGGVVAGHGHVHEEPLVLGPHHLPGLLGGLRGVVAGQQPHVFGCGTPGSSLRRSRTVWPLIAMMRAGHLSGQQT